MNDESDTWSCNEHGRMRCKDKRCKELLSEFKTWERQASNSWPGLPSHSRSDCRALFIAWSAGRTSAAAQFGWALKLAHRMCNLALPKFNWGASALDAQAIDLLNRAPVAINDVMREVK